MLQEIFYKQTDTADCNSYVLKTDFKWQHYSKFDLNFSKIDGTVASYMLTEVS